MYRRLKGPEARFIPPGSIKIAAKGCEMVAYVYEAPNGKPAAILYRGKSAKPYSWFRFASEAKREAHIAAAFKRERENAALKVAKLEKRKAWQHPYKPGDLFRRSWGYDQTNIDWYEVVEVKGKHLIVREIAQARSDCGAAAYSDKSVPLPGEFLADRDPFRVLAQDGRIKINHYAHAYYEAPKIVSGVRVYDSSYWSSYA